MKNIIYFDASDAQKFDFDRFKKSINSYAKVSDDEIKAALKDLDNYENLHVSRLVETGAALIAKNSDTSTNVNPRQFLFILSLYHKHLRLY